VVERPVRVLISDDHTLFREGVIEILAREPDLVVVGQTDSGEDTVAVAAQTCPDVLVLDVEIEQ